MSGQGVIGRVWRLGVWCFIDGRQGLDGGEVWGLSAASTDDASVGDASASAANPKCLLIPVDEMSAIARMDEMCQWHQTQAHPQLSARLTSPP